MPANPVYNRFDAESSHIPASSKFGAPGGFGIDV
jgi:hypothetical protein